MIHIQHYFVQYLDHPLACGAFDSQLPAKTSRSGWPFYFKDEDDTSMLGGPIRVRVRVRVRVRGGGLLQLTRAAYLRPKKLEHRNRLPFGGVVGRFCWLGEVLIAAWLNGLLGRWAGWSAVVAGLARGAGGSDLRPGPKEGVPRKVPRNPVSAIGQTMIVLPWCGVV